MPMEKMFSDVRTFDPEVLRALSRALADRADQLTAAGRGPQIDHSDLGNEIGAALGGLITGMTEQETRDLSAGIRHGVSLTNGAR